jgi:hypothetical protein
MIPTMLSKLALAAGILVLGALLYYWIFFGLLSHTTTSAPTISDITPMTLTPAPTR